MGLSQLALIEAFFTVTCTHFDINHIGNTLGLWRDVLIRSPDHKGVVKLTTFSFDTLASFNSLPPTCTPSIVNY